MFNFLQMQCLREACHFLVSIVNDKGMNYLPEIQLTLLSSFKKRSNKCFSFRVSLYGMPKQELRSVVSLQQVVTGLSSSECFYVLVNFILCPFYASQISVLFLNAKKVLEPEPFFKISKIMRKNRKF